MSVFSDAELAYLAKGKLGRLATIDGAGMPHVVPLGWCYNPELDTIDIGGRDFARTRKFRNAQHNPNVALVVDDVLPSGHQLEQALSGGRRPPDRTLSPDDAIDARR
jgi:pyridoxamine 5'-phosphate oxidase family protein